MGPTSPKTPHVLLVRAQLQAENHLFQLHALNPTEKTNYFVGALPIPYKRPPVLTVRASLLGEFCPFCWYAPEPPKNTRCATTRPSARRKLPVLLVRGQDPGKDLLFSTHAPHHLEETACFADTRPTPRFAVCFAGKRPIL